jgi:predicted Holliday junction resolvase-like endonuclease
MDEMTILVVSILINVLLAYLLIDQLRKRKMTAEREREIREDAIRKSRLVLEGKFKEQLVPIFPEFNYNPTDARFLGSPIDFIIFSGLSGDVTDEVVFLEVKTGNAQLSSREQILKEVIEKKKVIWELLRV